MFLSKWAKAAAHRTKVNAQYDISCLAEDIIGRIGLGQHLHQQQVPQSENHYAVARDFLLKEIILRTISPLQEHVAPPDHRAKVQRLQEEDRVRTEEMMQIALEASQLSADQAAAGADGEAASKAGAARARS